MVVSNRSQKMALFFSLVSSIFDKRLYREISLFFFLSHSGIRKIMARGAFQKRVYQKHHLLLFMSFFS